MFQEVYWKRPKFWLLLAAAEVTIFVFSAIISLVVSILIASITGQPGYLGLIANLILLAVFGYTGFRWARKHCMVAAAGKETE